MNNYTLIIGDAGLFSQTQPLGADKGWHNSVPITYTTDPLSPDLTLAQMMDTIEADVRFQSILFKWWHVPVGKGGGREGT